jgi:hypothetical protein
VSVNGGLSQWQNIPLPRYFVNSSEYTLKLAAPWINGYTDQKVLLIRNEKVDHFMSCFCICKNKEVEK